MIELLLSKINEETIVEEKEGLSDLTIEDVTLSPEFSSKQYSYTTKYIGEKTSLKIEATPADENYIIEITGNEELEEGENIVTILVSESDGSNVATYQIIINKSLVDYEEIAKQEAQKEQRRKIIIGAIIAIIVLIIIISIVIKKKRNDDYFDDEDDEEEDYDYEDEMPRALRNNNKNYNYEEENFEEMSKEEIRKKYLFK